MHSVLVRRPSPPHLRDPKRRIGRTARNKRGSRRSETQTATEFETREEGRTAAHRGSDRPRVRRTTAAPLLERGTPIRDRQLGDCCGVEDHTVWPEPMPRNPAPVTMGAPAEVDLAGSFAGSAQPDSIISSHVTVRPRSVAIRPSIAVRVLSAPRTPTFSVLPSATRLTNASIVSASMLRGGS